MKKNGQTVFKSLAVFKMCLIIQGIFQTYIAFDYRTLTPLLYFDTNHLEKGLNRGEGETFGALFSKKCDLFIKKCSLWPISKVALNFQNMPCTFFIIKGERANVKLKGSLNFAKKPKDTCLTFDVLSYDSEPIFDLNFPG